MLWIVFFSACLLLWWIYDGYGRFLQAAAWLHGGCRKSAHTHSGTVGRTAEIKGQAGQAPSGAQPSITILLTVHNEQEQIARRIQNLLECHYPADKLEILVASDGSTDQTELKVESFADRRVRLFRSSGSGKTATQNAALDTVTSDVLVFTDAGVLFDPGFLQEISLCFTDPNVGAAAGYLRFADDSGNPNIRSQGFYWNYELKLRTLESQLGILAVVAGSGFAVRRCLLRQMDPGIGEDCVVPLDVVSQGFRVVHALDAGAWDRFDADSGLTLRARIRMTLRNWQGTWSRPQLLNPFRHPGYAFALWSHKLLRWMSPVFLLTAVGAVLWILITEPGIAGLVAAAPFALLLTLGALHAIGQRLPGTGMAFSFLLANTAFLIGLLQAFRGRQVLSYRNG